MPVTGHHMAERTSDDILQPISDSDIDSLYVLPLDILPLETPALKRSRLIKNVRLKCAVEVFWDQQSGSGQIDIEALPGLFNWQTASVHPDLSILRRISILPSFDVYSLRISLREQGIPVNDYAALRLSPQKEAELSKYMFKCTKPLIKAIYANDDYCEGTFEDLMRLFRDPDVENARNRLESMARALGINVSEIPSFIENYGDTFLSISYFRHCFERIELYITSCLQSLTKIREHFQLKLDTNLMALCDSIEESINRISASVGGSLETIDRRVAELWEHTSSDEFRSVKAFIESYHLTLGTALCCLTVKMNAFARIFPKPSASGPFRLADFMIAEMIPGFEIIRGIDLSLTRPKQHHHARA
jgi:hypothetical protein